MQAQNYDYLQSLLHQLDELIRQAVNRIEANNLDAANALRGLVIHHEEAIDAIDEIAMSGLWSNTDEIVIDFGDEAFPFMQLASVFDLGYADCLILLLALAPELDFRYQRLYGYLQDDVTLRYPTPNLVMNLFADDSAARFDLYNRLQAHNILVKQGLLTVVEPENRNNSLFLQHTIRLNSAVLNFIIGQSDIDNSVSFVLEKVDSVPRLHVDEAFVKPIIEKLAQNPMIILSGETPLEQLETASAICTERTLPLFQFKLNRITEVPESIQAIWQMVLCQATMHRAALIITDWDILIDESGKIPEKLWQELCEFPLPVFICMSEMREPEHHPERIILRIPFEKPDYEKRLSAWTDFIPDGAFEQSELGELAIKYRFHRQQISDTVQTAHDIAQTAGRHQLNLDDLRQAAIAHTRLKLGNSAQQVIATNASWDRLILPDEPLAQLHEIVNRVRYANIVQHNWGYGNHISNSEGISALFAGESGTGKTLSARTLAAELGLPMYKIDLSGIVDKYIGETEKNLRVIFEEAQSNNAILFFDEADAIFGKRSEVKDARDRYANIEVAYMLQQIESYDGIAILATNLRQNLDEAFTRRLDFLITFPFPEPEYRHKIWLAHFPEQAPLDPSVDIMELAQRYELSGGNIRNVTLAAAYMAAAEGDRISLKHIQHAIRREHQKLGRLLDQL